MPKELFIVQLDELVKKEGYESITSFVNKWIQDGFSFADMCEWAMLRGLVIGKGAFYSNARIYLTVPFDANSHYHYKWNAIARAKDYPDFKTMIKDYRKRLTTKEICEELNITKNALRDVEYRMEWSKPRDPSKRSSFKVKYQARSNYTGFSSKATKEKWEKKFKDLGFKTLRETIIGLRKQGLTQAEMCIKLDVTQKGLNIRLRRAGIRFQELLGRLRHPKTD